MRRLVVLFLLPLLACKEPVHPYTPDPALPELCQAAENRMKDCQREGHKMPLRTPRGQTYGDVCRANASVNVGMRQKCIVDASTCEEVSLCL
jgi:hypothetical protein